MLVPKYQVIQALQSGKPERVPVGVVLGGSWPIHNAGLTLEDLIGDPVRTAQVFHQENEKLDADLLTIGTGSTALIIRALGGEIQFNSKGAPDIVSELIQNEQDLDRLNASPILSDPTIGWIRDSARELSRLCGDQRLILISGRAPFTLAGQMFGLENLCRTLYKNPGFAHRLLNFATRVSILFFTSIIGEGFVQSALIADPSSSGDVISLTHFQQFALPYLKRVVGEVRNLGGFVMLHICGNITDRLHLIPPAGAHCLSLDTKVSIARAREIVGKGFCLAGNVDPVESLQFGDEERVYRDASKCLEEGARDGAFILLPGCDLASQVPARNIVALVNAAHQWSG